MTNDPIAALMAYTIENGGGTFEQGTYLPFKPADGYAVAIAGITLTEADATYEAIKRWGKAIVTEHEASFLGTWLNEGLLYLDAVVYIRDLDFALRTASAHNQLAIFDFANMTSIPVQEPTV